jgi:hypothetical protein
MQQLENIRLKFGGHQFREDGLCAMEAVAYLAGEPHSDCPVCTCPILAAYVRSLNDGMDDETRQLLKPYILRLIGTNNDKEQERAELLVWAAVTEFAPLALEQAGLKDHADKLRNIPKYDWETAKIAIAPVAADGTWVSAAAVSTTPATYYAIKNAAKAAHFVAYAPKMAGIEAATSAEHAGSWDLALAALDRALEIK